MIGAVEGVKNYGIVWGGLIEKKKLLIFGGGLFIRR